jgi:hypothetical protein
MIAMIIPEIIYLALSFKNLFRQINISKLVECLSSLAIAMCHIRVQLEERQRLSNNSYSQLKRFKSQSDITSPSSSLHINQV